MAVAASLAAVAADSDGRGFGMEVHDLSVSKALVMTGGVQMPAGTVIAAATSLVPEDAGKTFLVTMPATTAYAITLPPLQDCVGAVFTFQVKTATAGAAAHVNITVPTTRLPTGGATQALRGVITDAAATSVTTGSIARFVGNVAVAGDRIELRVASFDATTAASNRVVLRGISSAIGGVTTAA